MHLGLPISRCHLAMPEKLLIRQWLHLTCKLIQLTVDVGVVISFAKSYKVDDFRRKVEDDVQVSLHDGHGETIAIGCPRHSTGKYHVSTTPTTQRNHTPIQSTFSTAKMTTCCCCCCYDEPVRHCLYEGTKMSRR